MIPKVIHFIWVSLGEEFQMKYRYGILSALENTNMRVVLHTDDASISIPGVEVRLREFPTTINKTVFNKDDQIFYGYQKRDVVTPIETLGKRVSHLKDIVRCEILYDEGGVYSDLDTLWFRNPWELFCKKVVIGWSNQAYKNLCNAVLMSEPGHPAMKKYKEWLISIYPCKKYWVPANPYKIWKDDPDVFMATKYMFFAVRERGIKDMTIEDVSKSICLHMGMSVLGNEKKAEEFYKVMTASS